MKITLSRDQKMILESFIEINPQVQNIKLAGVEYDLKAELLELRKLSKGVLTSLNKDIEVSRATNQNIISFVENYLRPCFNRVQILLGKPDNINDQVTGFKQEIESGKDFYLENLKVRLDIENIDTNVTLLQEKTETVVAKETILEASDLLKETVSFYATKERNTFILLSTSLVFTIFVVMSDFIKPNWLCFCFKSFCFDFTTPIVDKWIFTQHIAGKVTFILVIGYWINILARNYKLYSALHIKNKSKNDVANIILKQGEILQKSNLVTPETKSKVMESILAIDEGKVEKDLNMNEMEQISKIVSNFGNKLS